MAPIYNYYLERLQVRSPARLTINWVRCSKVAWYLKPKAQLGYRYPMIVTQKVKMWVASTGLRFVQKLLLKLRYECCDLDMSFWELYGKLKVLPFNKLAYIEINKWKEQLVHYRAYFSSSFSKTQKSKNTSSAAFAWDRCRRPQRESCLPFHHR